MTNQQGAPEALYASAMEFAAEKASISYVQRKCRCSWNDAEQMLERMVREGIIATYNGRKSAALVEAQQRATHVQNPSEIEHVAGDVSKNGPESNMAQQPALSVEWQCGQQASGFSQQPAPSAAAASAVSDGQRALHKAILNRLSHAELLEKAHYLMGLNSNQARTIGELQDLLKAAPQPSPTPQADSHPAPVLLSDEELCQIEEPYLLNFRIPLGGQYDFARAVEKAVICKMGKAHAPQGETNVQLDIDSNHSAPGQQWNVAGAVALGQPVGDGPNQVAGHLGAQGDKLLTVAERNIRSFLRSAQFKSESDREAALNCVDVLWAAARAPADSVLEDAARWQWLADYLVGDRTDLDDEIVACTTVDALRQFADAARKQGGKP